MSERELKIRVGAALDSSFSTVFAQVLTTIKKVRQQIEREMGASIKVSVAAQKAGGKETAKVFDDTAKSAKKAADQTTRDAAQAIKQRIRDERNAMREVERDLREHNRNRTRLARENARIFREEQAKASRIASNNGPRSFGERLGTSIATRAAAAAVALPMRVAGDVLRGFGVKTGVAEHLQGAVSNEALSSKIATMAYMPGRKGPEGSERYQTADDVERGAAKVGMATGLLTEDVLKGADAFVGLTGDLKTLQANMLDLAKIAKANGTDFEDVSKAAAQFVSQLGEDASPEEKKQGMSQFIRSMGGQGQMSSIELSDQAKNAAMIAANSRFAIDPHNAKILAGAGVTNETAQRMAVVNSLALMARDRGGRTSSRMATQSAQSFMSDMNNPTEQKRMAAQGLRVYTDSTNTKQRDPIQLLLDMARVSMTKNGTLDRAKLLRMTPNKQARALPLQVAADFEDAYNKSRKTTQLEKEIEASEAVVAKYDKVLGAVQSMSEVEEKLAMEMKTVDSRSKALNDQLGESARELKTGLVPALTALTPAIVAAGQFIARTVNMAMGTATTSEGIEQGNVVTVDADVSSANAHLRRKKKAGTLTNEDITSASEALRKANEMQAKKNEEITLRRKMGWNDFSQFDKKLGMENNYKQLERDRNELGKTLAEALSSGPALKVAIVSDDTAKNPPLPPPPPGSGVRPNPPGVAPVSADDAVKRWIDSARNHL